MNNNSNTFSNMFALNENQTKHFNTKILRLLQYMFLTERTLRFIYKYSMLFFLFVSFFLLFSYSNCADKKKTSLLTGKFFGSIAFKLFSMFFSTRFLKKFHNIVGLQQVVFAGSYFLLKTIRFFPVLFSYVKVDLPSMPTGN